MQQERHAPVLHTVRVDDFMQEVEESSEERAGLQLALAGKRLARSLQRDLQLTIALDKCALATSTPGTAQRAKHGETRQARRSPPRRGTPGIAKRRHGDAARQARRQSTPNKAKHARHGKAAASA